MPDPQMAVPQQSKLTPEFVMEIMNQLPKNEHQSLMPNYQSTMNLPQEQPPVPVNSILKQKSNPSNSINDMLVQYFIHKEFVEPQMRAQKFVDAEVQCSLDKEIQIQIPPPKVGNPASSEGTPFFKQRTLH